MLRRTFVPFLVLTVVVAGGLALPTATLAQGTISGSVTDQDGAPIGFAQVSIQGTDLGTVADQSGAYTIRGVPAGSHVVQTTVLGYRTQTATVQVPDGGSATQDFALGQDYLGMEAIVATAQRTPRLKLETSTAVTTLTPRDIQRDAPRSTADLLKVVPGFYVESSGGEVGGNLFARGLPADGSFRYVALLEDGMPVYDSTELSFVNADIFVRVDDNIQSVEAVRGGSAALFGSNAPGGLINFISKTGGPATTGTFDVKAAQAGLVRLDGNVNGPLSESGWRYSLGGFYRYDDGIRDPGFAASKGGQIKANVTKAFNGGYVRVYGKYLNDRNIFYLPLPLENPTDPSFVEGFPDDGTLTSEEGVGKQVPFPDGSTLTLNLDDGQYQNGGSFLVDLGFDLGNDWSVQNAFRYMNIDHHWNAMLPFDLQDADTWAQGFVDDTPNGASYSLTYTDNGQAFDTANGLVNLAGEWFIKLPMTSVSDQVQLKKVAGRHDFTVGTYLSHYTADPTWHFNDVVTNVQNAPRFLDLAVRNAAGDVIRQVTDEGFRQYLSLYLNAEQSVNLAAFFLGDDIDVTDRFDLDLGVRVEHDAFDIKNEDTGSFDVQGGTTDATTGLNFGTGEFTQTNRDFTEWAYSAGGNYRVNDYVSIYGRGTSGYKMPILDNVRSAGDEGALEVEKVAQVEGGLKVGSPKLGLSAVAYWLRIKNFPSGDVVIDPDTGATEFVTNFAGEARTIGTELEVVTAPVPNLRLNGTATFQNPEYQEFIVQSSSTCANPVGEKCDLAGNRVRRIPQVLLDVGATVDIGNASVNGDWSFIGERFSNNENTITLDSYNVIDLGAEYRLVDFGVTLSLALKNVADAGPDALTEGNPRLDESRPAQSQLFLARPILPRRLEGGISYDF